MITTDIVPDSNNCWRWTGRHDRHGYGRLGPRLAHRIVYELLMEAIPDGLTLDHLCRVRDCVNPAHLEPVTMRENILRGEGVAATETRQTACVNGHSFDAANTYHYTNRDGRTRRCCRACNRKSQAKVQSRRWT